MANSKSSTKKKKLIKYIVTHTLSFVVSLIFIAAMLMFALWMMFYVHPGIMKEEKNQPTTKMDLSSRIMDFGEESRQNVLINYLSDNQIKKKVYKVEAGELAPMPHESCYGSFASADAANMDAVIDRAREIGLLEGQEVAFDSSAVFYNNCTIKYYLDDTILVILWKEIIDGKALTFAEIKIADPSQFGRKLVDDKYGSGKQMFCSSLSRQVNAVLGLNADYYAFRNLGITCYDGVIYRTEDSLDTLFIDENGDFILYDRRQHKTKDELQQYVDDNHINFGLSFGPIMVRDGEAVMNGGYPIGQTTEIYSRAGIGQMDKLHYLFVNVENHGEGRRPSTVNDYAPIMVQKGIKTGYNLDGGQTGEAVFQGKFYNFVDYGNERDVSDIIYFTTALPDSDVVEY